MEVEVRGSILPNPIIFGKQSHIVANRIATWRPLIGPLGRQLDTTWIPLVHGPYQLDAKYLPCGSLRLCHATTSADCTSCHVSFVHATCHPYGGATWNPFLPNFTCFAENSERHIFHVWSPFEAKRTFLESSRRALHCCKLPFTI